MKIYYGYNFNGDVFIDFKSRDGIMMDSIVVNTMGLVALLREKLGLYNYKIDNEDRQIAYLKAMRKVMARRPNLLSQSWEKNRLGVSNVCMAWRDALNMAGWKADMPQPTDRLQLLAEIDKEFDDHFLGDVILDTMAAIKKNPLGDAEIIVDETSPQELPPLVGALLDTLSNVGVKVCYNHPRVMAREDSNLGKFQRLLLNNQAIENLDKEDESLRIWHFNTEMDAYRYVVGTSVDFDAYVNSHDKLFDNVQRMFGQPTSGSRLTGDSAQLAQMFRIGLNLFEYPLNIRTLLSWLDAPLHPLPSELRHALSRAIIETGGYDNEKCKNAIETVRNKIVEKDETGKKAKAFDQNMEIFLPMPKAEGVDKNALLTFVAELGTWASKMINIADLAENKKEQLAIIKRLCDAFTDIFNDIEDEVIPYRRVETCGSTLNYGNDLRQYEPEAQSRHTCTCDKLLDAADNIIWLDCFNYEPAKYPYAFLNQYERNMLAQNGCRIWGEDEFNLSNIRALRQPLLKARKKLVIVVVDNANGATATKHPILIRIEEACKSIGKNVLDTIVQKFEDDNIKIDEVKRVDNHEDATEIHFDKDYLRKFRGTESYTSLSTLIQYPLDYVLTHIASLYDRSATALSDIYTTEGLVTHAVIEELFKGDGNSISNNLMSHFEDVVTEKIIQKGAILLLPENKISQHDFIADLRDSLQVLLDIIQTNHLTVVDNEHWFSDPIGLNPINDPLINGSVDMVLKNADGELVLFDFKWSSSKSHYKTLLQENRSLQLALYEYMIDRDETLSGRVVATAYFQMPSGKLFTTSESLIGEAVERIAPDNMDDLISMIKNSYTYRRNQIENGIIENGEGRLLEELQYHLDSSEQGLFPLETDYHDDALHSANNYSNYKCLKNSFK